MSESLPPHVQLIQMGTAHWVARLIYMAAELNLGDRLADGPKSAADLAGPTGTHERSLHRLLRTLASLGVLTAAGDGRFALTPLGEALKTGAPGSARETLMAFGGAWMWTAFGEFGHSLRTGQTAMAKAHGMEIFEFLRHHPQEAAYFSSAMVGFHGGEPPTVAEAFDFSRFDTIVDVGGATGNMLAHILTRHPHPRGVLFDRPHVVTEAPALIAARGLTDRITIEQGDFFERVPEGGDAYILSHIVHDWSEEQNLTILGNCRRAMKPGSRLLIVEFVLPEGGEPHLGYIADMVMLAFPGGEERTAAEYETLLAKAGFTMERVVPTASAVSIVEASPA
jgi:SAM-dependent methyltransferase